MYKIFSLSLIIFVTCIWSACMPAHLSVFQKYALVDFIDSTDQHVGRGVVIDPRGTILTVAHLFTMRLDGYHAVIGGQKYFLLPDVIDVPRDMARVRVLAGEGVHFSSAVISDKIETSVPLKLCISQPSLGEICGDVTSSSGEVILSEKTFPYLWHVSIQLDTGMSGSPLYDPDTGVVYALVVGVTVERGTWALPIFPARTLGESP